MDAHDKAKPDGWIEECFKNNLRIRLYQVRKNDGELSFLVDVVAWNAWAGQSKILYAIGGIDFDSAKEVFQTLATNLSHYDWAENEFVTESKEAGG